MDKIGLDEVAAELAESGFDQTQIGRYLDLFRGMQNARGLEGRFQFLADTLGDFLETSVRNNLEEIIRSVEHTRQQNLKVVFDPTLVRGMSYYYTGTIFEIAMPQYGGSCAAAADVMVIKWWESLPDRIHRRAVSPLDLNVSS